MLESDEKSANFELMLSFLTSESLLSSEVDEDVDKDFEVCLSSSLSTVKILLSNVSSSSLLFSVHFSHKFSLFARDLYYAFKKFDLDNSGYISVKELQQILARIGQHYSTEQIAELVSKVDANSDGRLSYQEFVKLMKLPASR